jgi:hypothetical protein
MKITKQSDWIGSLDENLDGSFTVYLGNTNKKLTFKNIEVFRKFVLNIGDAYSDAYLLSKGDI